MHHDTDNTASQDGMQGTPDIEDENTGARIPPESDSSEPDEDTGKDTGEDTSEDTGEYYAKMIDHNLRVFRGQFRRLKEAIEHHIRPN